MGGRESVCITLPHAWPTQTRLFIAKSFAYPPYSRRRRRRSRLVGGCHIFLFSFPFSPFLGVERAIVDYDYFRLRPNCQSSVNRKITFHELTSHVTAKKNREKITIFRDLERGRPASLCARGARMLRL
jgi:hypothetical protein